MPPERRERVITEERGLFWLPPPPPSPPPRTRSYAFGNFFSLHKNACCTVPALQVNTPKNVLELEGGAHI